MGQAWRAQCLLGWVTLDEWAWTVSGLLLCPSSDLVNPLSLTLRCCFSSFRTVILSDGPCTRFWVVIMGFIAFLKTQFIVHLLIGFVFVVSGLIINFIQLCTLVLWPINKQLYRRVNCRLAYSLWSREYAGVGWAGVLLGFDFVNQKKIYMRVCLFAHRDERNDKFRRRLFQSRSKQPFFFFSGILGGLTEVKGLMYVVTVAFRKVGSKAPLHLQPYVDW